MLIDAYLDQLAKAVEIYPQSDIGGLKTSQPTYAI